MTTLELYELLVKYINKCTGLGYNQILNANQNRGVIDKELVIVGLSNFRSHGMNEALLEDDGNGNITKYIELLFDVTFQAFSSEYAGAEDILLKIKDGRIRQDCQDVLGTDIGVLNELRNVTRLPLEYNSEYTSHAIYEITCCCVREVNYSTNTIDKVIIENTTFEETYEIDLIN